MTRTAQPNHRGRTRLREGVGLLAAATLVAGTAACSGGSSASGNAGGASQSKNVSWWGWAPGKQLADTYLAEFKKEHPDIKVTYKEIPYDTYVNALRLGMRSSSGPDVFALQPGEITDRFAASAMALDGMAEKSLGADWKSNEVGGAQEQFARDGKQIGMPVQLSASGLMWYDKTLFDKVGVKVPTTMDELEQVCQKFEAQKITCVAQGAKDAWANMDVYMTLAADLAPGVFYDAVEGKKRWTDPGLVKTFEVWKQMMDAGIFGKGAMGLATYPDTSTNFATGKAAMTILGTWQATFMNNTAQKANFGKNKYVKLVLLPAPFPDVNGDGQPPKTFGGPDYGLAIRKGTKSQDATWTFIQWLAASKSGQQMVADQEFVPAIKGVELSDKDLVEPSVQKPALKQIVDFMENSDGYREIPYADLKTALGDALAAVAVGKQSPQQAAESVQKASDTIKRNN